MMKPSWILLALPIAQAMVAAPASARPDSSHFGLGGSPLTLELEGTWRVSNGPLGLSAHAGAMGYPHLSASAFDLTAGGNWVTVWGHYDQALTETLSWGALAGTSQSWFFDGIPIPFRTTYSKPQPFMGLVGVYAQFAWRGGWLRLCPSATFPLNSPDYQPRLDWWEGAMLGPAIVELGFALGETTSLVLRPSLTPLSITWKLQ